MSSTLLRRSAVLATAATVALGLSACGGSNFEDDANESSDSGSESDDASESGASGEGLDILIAPSGDAEKEAVTEAVAAWSAESGIEATVRAAADLPQELSQGFAAASPPDVFYVSTDQFAGYAANGSLYPYLDELENASDFYPALVETFTYDETAYCAPKDFSTLALVINNTAWAEAGLTEADIPTDWDGLQTVATTLAATNDAGLSFGPEWQRIGTFMAQAGGGLLDDDGAAALDSEANLEALTYVKGLLDSGAAKYPSEINAGWGGEAFGTGAAAMTIEGNWIMGAMSNDYPDIDFQVVELPAGAGGQGTLTFTNCWGIAADSGNQAAAVELVEYLTSGEQQMAFATGFGVMPSIESVSEEWAAEFPEQEAFLAGSDYAQGVPPVESIADVIADFNSQLETLTTGDPATILSSAQSNLAAILP